MRRFVCAAALLLSVGGTACATAQAGGRSAGPALDTPVPPPHVVQTPDEPVAPARPEGADTPREPVAARPASPKPVVPERTMPEKPDPVPPPPLQTSANVAEVEKQARTLLQQATRNLERIDYRSLTADGRAEFDTATRFVRQAMTALQEKDVTFAEQLARKAATLAARLVGREGPQRPVSAETMPA